MQLFGIMLNTDYTPAATNPMMGKIMINTNYMAGATNALFCSHGKTIQLCCHFLITLIRKQHGTILRNLVTRSGGMREALRITTFEWARDVVGVQIALGTEYGC